jgi:hypothetical protein
MTLGKLEATLLLCVGSLIAFPTVSADPPESDDCQGLEVAGVACTDEVTYCFFAVACSPGGLPPEAGFICLNPDGCGGRFPHDHDDQGNHYGQDKEYSDGRDDP